MRAYLSKNMILEKSFLFKKVGSEYLDLNYREAHVNGMM